MGIKYIRAKAPKFIFACALSALLLAPQASAITSPNFMIQEDFLGGGGAPQSSSGGYSARDSVGSTAVGNSTGNAYKTQSGAPTADEPTLSFSVNTASVNLGSLSTALTRTGTASFSVLNYTSYGYVVQTIGNPPDNGAHTLTGMNPAASSASGTEQFGVNLKANTSPATFGADPNQFPDNSFGFGDAASGYDTANTFKYAPGDVIANAPKSSGRTDYTLSYIANISSNTPGGSYSSEQTLVVTGTY